MSGEGEQKYFHNAARRMLDKHLDKLNTDYKIQRILQEMPVGFSTGTHGCEQRQLLQKRKHADDKSECDDDRNADLKDIHQMLEMSCNKMNLVALRLMFFRLNVYVLNSLF